MFQTVLWHVSVALVICVFTLVKSEDCQTNEVKQGCTVDNGHAQCESWDLASIVSRIHGLPACTTKITFLLVPKTSENNYNEVGIYLMNANFSHLSNLTELSVLVNRKYYDNFRLHVHQSDALHSLASLRTLRLKVKQEKVLELLQQDAGIYSTFKDLDVLDLTRAKRTGLSNLKYFLGKK